MSGRRGESWEVIKFGGSTVGNPQRLVAAIGWVRAAWAAGRVAIVVSAFGKTTDRLLDVVAHVGRGDGAAAFAELAALREDSAAVVGEARRLLGLSASTRVERLLEDSFAPLRDAVRGAASSRLSPSAFSDYVLSFGEQLSAGLVADLFTDAGLRASAVDARTFVRTDAAFGAARPLDEETFARLRPLARDWGSLVPVVTGFIGETADGRSTTLGRNGSDDTAALLAVGLGAESVTTWTDVPGVMTADPELISDAWPVPHLTHQEAFELAQLGLPMFHPRAMHRLWKSGITLRIRPAASPELAGTQISAASPEEVERPTSIVSIPKLALIDLDFAEGALARQLGARALALLEEAGIAPRVAVQSPLGRSLTLVLPDAAVEPALALLEREFARELASLQVEPLRHRRQVTLVTLLAEAMGKSADVAGRLFHSVGAVGVKVHAIAQGSASRSISFAVDSSEAELTVTTVHAALNFSHVRMSLLLLGRGVVGSQLLQQLSKQQWALKAEHGIDMSLVGLRDSKHALFDPRGLWLGDLDSLRARLDTSAAGDQNLIAELELLRRLPAPALVDCTADGNLDAAYLEAFARGIHVVAANKKPLTQGQARRDELLATADRQHRYYHYETTVGAGLPVIGTLKDLVRTGDHVRLIEGSFSGTLGFLANEVSAGVPLSVAVQQARARGFTEPYPGDDLQGLDVARKALILARELGMQLELEEIDVEPFVPRELLLGQGDTEALLAALRAHDAAFADRMASIRREGRRLRYLARIDPSVTGRRQVSVGPVAVGPDHPAFGLRGSEAFVAFTTERYSDYPLLVQGAGAGGAVTAAGVLADIFKIGQNLRGR